MSREIKFRAWNAYAKTMYEVDLLHIRNSKPQQPTHLEGNYMSLVYQPKVVLMQYTGRTDSKDAEIYEGDICLVTHHEEFEDDSYYNEFHMKVCWDVEQATWILEGDHDDYNLGRILHLGEKDWSYSVEVIGNIYENPELLEAGDD